jgi:hypothetical protein
MIFVGGQSVIFGSNLGALCPDHNPQGNGKIIVSDGRLR